MLELRRVLGERCQQAPLARGFISTEEQPVSTVQETSNKAAFRRLHDATNTGDAELVSKAIDDHVEPQVLIRTPLPIEATGAQALKEVFVKLHRAFPDLHIKVEDLIAEGDKVVSRNSVTGTHQGEYMGLSPTGKTVAYNEILVCRFVNGRIAETWGIVDVFSQMQQLGVIAAQPSRWPER
jgi:predicted ester cyclase